MIAEAHMVPRKRKPTRPSRAAKAKRVDEKKGRSADQGGARASEAGLMYDFKIEAADKATLYADLASALEGLVAGEPDGIANMANAAGLIWESLPDINWVGFYRNIGGELVLGPFQGRPACIRIAVRPRRVRRRGARPGRCSGSRTSMPSPATSPATARRTAKSSCR